MVIEPTAQNLFKQYTAVRMLEEFEWSDLRFQGGFRVIFRFSKGIFCRSDSAWKFKKSLLKTCSTNIRKEIARNDLRMKHSMRYVGWNF